MRKTVIAFLLVASMALTAGVAKAADMADMKSKFDVTFYGYVKAEMIYHSARALGTNYIIIAYPDIEPYNKQHSLALTVRQSRLGFNIGAPGPSESSKVLGNVEFDFYGGSSYENKQGFQLRRATVTLKYPSWNLLAGQDWMLMSPLYPHVSNYPAGAGMGNLGYRMPQIRFTMGDQLRFAVSVNRKIEGDLVMSDFDAGSMSTVPDTQVQLGYWGKNGLIAVLSGHYAEEEFLDLASPGHYKDRTFPSWSANLSFNIPFGKRIALDGEVFYGANLDGWYTGGIFAQGIGRRSSGKRVEVRDVGGWIELMVKPTSKLTFYGGYGIDDPNDDDLAGGSLYPFFSSDPYLTFAKNQMYYGHLWYDITPAFKVSLEVMQVRTDYKKYDHPETAGTVWSSDLAFWFFF